MPAAWASVAFMCGVFASLGDGMAMQRAFIEQDSFDVEVDVESIHSAAKPNILFILVDDLGWSDIGFNIEDTARAKLAVPTPAIDGLARAGLILKRHYMHKFCSPSRSAIQSGRAPIHVNVMNADMFFHLAGDDEASYAGIPRHMTCIATVLKTAGYHTHMVGKWDVGMATPDHTPAGRGYDTSLVYFDHSADRWDFRGATSCGAPHDLWMHNQSTTFPGRPAIEHLNPEGCSYRNQTGCKYLDQLFKERVIDIIESHDRHSPLFLFWATAAVHGRYQPPDAEFSWVRSWIRHNKNMEGNVLHWYADKGAYYGMLHYIDGAIGEVINALRVSNLYLSTLVVFSSDNGGVAGYSNEPLRGGKFTNYEGGIRVASFVSGGFLPRAMRGRTLDGLVAAWDWYATFAHLAGVSPRDYRASRYSLPAVDSINMWPFLSGQRASSPRTQVEIGTLRGSMGSKQATHSGRAMVGGIVQVLGDKLYKLSLGEAPGQLLQCDTVFGPFASMQGRPDAMFCNRSSRACGTTPQTGCLYELKSDPSEDRNVARDEPEIFNSLLNASATVGASLYGVHRGSVSGKSCDRVRLEGFVSPFAS